MIAALNIVILLTLLCYCDGIELTFCKSTEKDFKNCLKKSAQEIILLSKNDIPEFDLPSLAVYKTPSVTIQAGIGAVDLVQHYKNVEIYGVTDAVVNDAYFDKDKKIFGLTLTIPKYTQKADYTIEGKLLSVPVVGSGPSILEFDNLQMKNVLHLEEYPRDGKTYYKVKSYDLDLSTTKLYSHFDNMFNGNKLLGDNINKLLNDEWEVVFQDTKSAIENAVKAIIQPYIQHFFDKVPADELF
ncbi:circadian clock-controlled protein-like [Sitophilus oryzae]|uniref:Circadian clock-controlled protein-like n=1 Tax=Sitophilus oryzae TaxID=7048 RepID=A0A6J2YIB7_SITOR|nr:circadian clock-controlled protein-like [Sitophilus oryzae]